MIHGVSAFRLQWRLTLCDTVAFRRNLQHTAVVPWALRWEQQPCDRLSKQSACDIRSELRGTTVAGADTHFVVICSRVKGGGTFLVGLGPSVCDGSQRTSSLWRMVVYFWNYLNREWGRNARTVLRDKRKPDVEAGHWDSAFPKWCRLVLQLTTSAQQSSLKCFFPRSSVYHGCKQ